MSEPYTAIQIVMMPKHTNPHGTIFGGVLLANIDLAGAILGAIVFGALGWVLSGSITALVGHIRRVELVLLVTLIIGGGIVLWVRRAAEAREE